MVTILQPMGGVAAKRAHQSMGVGSASRQQSKTAPGRRDAQAATGPQQAQQPRHPGERREEARETLTTLLGMESGMAQAETQLAALRMAGSEN